VGLTCNVYSGKKLVKLNLTDEMIGHKAGEFSPTRAKFVYKKKKKK
jgi:ribosomal protein S19